MRANTKESQRLKRFPLAANPDDFAHLVGATPSAEHEVLFKDDDVFNGLQDRALWGIPEAERQALLVHIETGMVGKDLAEELTKRLRETGVHRR